MRFWGFFLLFFSLLQASVLETFYGPIEVEEELVWKLINTPAFQRLKGLHQYGVSHYTNYPEEYTRYDHSIGVFALLRLKGAPFQEQVAGLLHDVSHTVFSHVGDFLFWQEYADDRHGWFLAESGLRQILSAHGIDEVDPKSGRFPMLEQPLPELSADRLDYNLQGAVRQGWMSHQEALQIVDGLFFDGTRWIASHPVLVAKLGRFALYMTYNCWGSAQNYVESMALASLLKSLSFDQIHFGTDDLIWALVGGLPESLADTFCLGEPADLIYKGKFRGIDPWMDEGKRLTEIDPSYLDDFMTTKEKMEAGWPIRWRPRWESDL
jgi:hypothetical protein